MERTKEPTRDYLVLSRTPWAFWETIYARRSHRKYLPATKDAGLERELRETAGLAVSARGAEESDLLVVTDKGKVEEIKRRAHRGAPNKINLWLTRAPLLGFLVLAVPVEDVRGERPHRLPRAVTAAHDTVLWLTEKGLGTCWLGGINQNEVRKALGLGRELLIPAVVSFGKPKPRVRAGDFDHLVYLAISRRRKPLSAVGRWQSMEKPFIVGEHEPRSFSASPVQDVAGLLRKLTEDTASEGDVPLALALEACLEAARLAPSAGNAQRWRFVAVTEEGRLSDLALACGARATWRAAVVGAGCPGGWEETFLEKTFWMVDVPIAFSQLSLMAASMDLGVELYLDGFEENRVRRAAGSAPDFRPVGVMGIR